MRRKKFKEVFFPLKKARIKHYDLDDADDKSGTIRIQVVPEQQPCSDASNQGSSDKIDPDKNPIDPDKNPKRYSRDTAKIVTHLSGMCSAYFKDHFKRKNVWIGMFNTVEEAELAIIIRQIDVIRKRSILSRTGKITNRVLQEPKPSSEACKSEPSSKIDNGKKPERWANDWSIVTRQPCGKYSAQFKDPLKSQHVWLGLFDTAKEAEVACRRRQLEVDRRSMLALAGKDRIKHRNPNVAELSSHDGDGKIINQAVQDRKRGIEAYDQGLDSGPSGKIDRRKKPARQSISSFRVVRQPCGKYSAEFKDQSKRRMVSLGMFVTEEEAEVACRRQLLEVDRRMSMLAFAGKDRTKRRNPNAAELSSRDDDGKIRNRVEQDRKPCSVAYDQGLNSGTSDEIDRGKKPERQSKGSFRVVRQPCGKYSAEFKDQSKRRMVSLGMFDTEKEAEWACRHRLLEVGRRMSMLALAGKDQIKHRYPDAAELSSHDDDGITNRAVQNLKPYSEAHDQDLNSGPSGKIGHRKKPERQSNGSFRVGRHPCGKYIGEFKDQSKRRMVSLGMFDTEEEAEVACRRRLLEVDRRSMPALVGKDRIKHRNPDAAELLSHDEDGKITNREVQDQKRCSEAYDQGLNSGPCGKIDRREKPERQLNGSPRVGRHPCGKYTAEFKDQSKRQKVSRGKLDKEEEAKLACRHKQLEGFGRSMRAMAGEELKPDNTVAAEGVEMTRPTHPLVKLRKGKKSS